eukprot:TRINITY_DN1372_c3_g1_i1.p1 TRINITY_DN1372_c3_g1~~TRINITY_DN1372_c3_g1_i1.p1  ORF type:complete len:279 (-),score=40.91 TRINITY_DN1372_c3_g1_i1:137-973(-)
MCVLDDFLPADELARLRKAAQSMDRRNMESGLVQQRRNGELYFTVTSLGLEDDSADIFNRTDKPAQWSMFKDEMTYFADSHPWDALTKATDTLVSRLSSLDGASEKSDLKDIAFREEMQLACFRRSSKGRYQQHIDTDGGAWRKLTAIFYLNDDWKLENGGELRMFSPGVHSTEVRSDVLPVGNRLVLFWSDQRCPHEVLPTQQDRWAATIWYSHGPSIVSDFAGGARQGSRSAAQCDSNDREVSARSAVDISGGSAEKRTFCGGICSSRRALRLRAR